MKWLVPKCTHVQPRFHNFLRHTLCFPTGVSTVLNYYSKTLSKIARIKRKTKINKRVTTNHKYYRKLQLLQLLGDVLSRTARVSGLEIQRDKRWLWRLLFQCVVQATPFSRIGSNRTAERKAWTTRNLIWLWLHELAFYKLFILLAFVYRCVQNFAIPFLNYFLIIHKCEILIHT